jgi:toxin CptA
LLVVRLKPSKRLAVILSLAHFTATGLLWPLALPITVKFAGSVLLAGSLVLYVRYFALLASPGSVRSLKLGLDAADVMICMLETRRGDHMACALLGSSFVAPYLTVLELKPLGFQKLWQRFSSRSVVILPDGIDTEEFRQLRVLLRWKWKDARKWKDAEELH